MRHHVERQRRLDGPARLTHVHPQRPAARDRRRRLPRRRPLSAQRARRGKPTPAQRARVLPADVWQHPHAGQHPRLARQRPDARLCRALPRAPPEPLGDPHDRTRRRAHGAARAAAARRAAHVGAARLQRALAHQPELQDPPQLLDGAQHQPAHALDRARPRHYVRRPADCH